ncbi:MAG TPA: class II fumarate hydratase [Candidatus Sulfopaludibacter sp.]|jgi:fumarate hydratase class II|nr:class II fumarate hydratase [Candidatus Sulfopaludibacter sp.]
MSAGYRTEKDSMGEMRVAAASLYGAQTARAIENFPISGKRFPRTFLKALALIKSAAARVNGRRGYLPAELASKIEAAAEQVAEGRHDGEFPIDIFQTGSGTSTNMNANEVIGHLAGAHPNDHVNRGMSSNDAIPTALHIAAAEAVHARLLPSMQQLEASLTGKAREFHDVITIGRTHLQDAVPIRMGQRFGGYARQVAAARERVQAALPGIYELPLGGTAVGTGLNAPAGFAAEVIAELAARTGLPLREARDHFEAQASRDAAAFLSAAMRNYALGLTKIANDLRWLGSGPRCGLGELRVPGVQPGSSIMPGKVNPVIAESLLMVCAQVVGYDATIAWCAAAGNFELNVMMPVMAYDLLEAVELLAASGRNFAAKLIDGLEVDRDRAAGLVEQSLAMGTALAPEIGYDRAAELVKDAYRTGRTIREVAREKSGVSAERLEQLLDPESQV